MRIVSWNVQKATGARLRQQLEVVAAHRPTVVFLQEFADVEQHGSPALHAASQLLGSGYRGFQSYAPRTGCNLAVFVAPGLEPVKFKTTSSDAYWHARCHLKARHPDLDTGLDLVCVHLDPFDPDWRMREAYLLAELADPGRHTILAGDQNGFPADTHDDEPDWTRLPPSHRVRHCLHRSNPPRVDRRAAEVLADAGFIDTGAADGNPTGGFNPARYAPYRVDRVLLSPDLAPALTSYQRLGRELLQLSNHLPIRVDLALQPR